MSRSWNFVHVSGVEGIPAIATVDIVVSVESLSIYEIKESGEIILCAYPALEGASIAIGRRLVFTREERPVLQFSYRHVGEIDLFGETVYLLLEKGVEK